MRPVARAASTRACGLHHRLPPQQHAVATRACNMVPKKTKRGQEHPHKRWCTGNPPAAANVALKVGKPLVKHVL
eukprot:5566241-Alexandrium_andersonii.AAC.1